MIDERPDACWRHLVGIALGAGIVAFLFLKPTDVTAQTWLRGELSVLPGFSPAAIVEQELSDWLSVTTGWRLWRRQTDCPDDFPSTCGEDGWSAYGGLRPQIARSGALRVAVDVEAGWHHFSDDARRGDDTLLLGVRGVIRWVRTAAIEAGFGYRRTAGYTDETGLEFPALGFQNLDLGIAVPLR